MIAVHLPGGPDDCGELVDALLAAADACDRHAPALAARRRALAHELGDALDSLPRPTPRED